jgi:hypothetical protein
VYEYLQSPAGREDETQRLIDEASNMRQFSDKRFYIRWSVKHVINRLLQQLLFR